MINVPSDLIKILLMHPRMMPDVGRRIMYEHEKIVLSLLSWSFGLLLPCWFSGGLYLWVPVVLMMMAMARLWRVEKRCLNGKP